MDLTGKVAFVTGGSGDIGGAIAKALAESGVNVAISYVGDADRANSTVNVVQRVGRQSVAVRLDQRDPISIDRSARSLLAYLCLLDDCSILVFKIP